jgi:hypothetical protein
MGEILSMFQLCGNKTRISSLIGTSRKKSTTHTVFPIFCVEPNNVGIRFPSRNMRPRPYSDTPPYFMNEDL